MMSGDTYSECLIPRENLGAVGLFTDTFSGLWAPGPGFWVESESRERHDNIHVAV